MSLARRLNQEITHWPVTDSDGYGGFVFGTPVCLEGRWEEKNELFVTPDLEEVASMAIAYLEDDIAVGDYLALGDLTATADPTTLDDAHRIRNYGKVTDLRAILALRKAWM